MDAHTILSSVLSLIFVLCLIGLVALAFKKYGNPNLAIKTKTARRLSIKEVLPIDAKKKVVLIGVDDREVLLAISENNIEVIEKDIIK